MTPFDIEAVSGDSAIVHCQGAGKPEPSVAWSRIIGKIIILLLITYSVLINLPFKDPVTRHFVHWNIIHNFQFIWAIYNKNLMNVLQFPKQKELRVWF